MINYDAKRNKIDEQINAKDKTEVRFADSSFARTAGRVGDLTSSPWYDRDEGPGKTTEKQKTKKTRGEASDKQSSISFPPPQNQIGAWFCSTLVLPSVQFYGFVYCICHGARRRILKGYPAQCTGTHTCGDAATPEIIIGRNLGPVARREFRKTADLQKIISRYGGVVVRTQAISGGSFKGNQKM